MCNYFALCPRYPNGMVEHPVLDRVPTCTRCADKMEQTLWPFTHEEASDLLQYIQLEDRLTYEKLKSVAHSEMNEVAPEDLYCTDINQWMLFIVRNDNAEVFA